VAVTVRRLSPGASGTSTVQSAAGASEPPPPRSFVQLRPVTPTLSVAMPPSVTVGTAVVAPSSDVGLVTRTSGGTRSTPAGGTHDSSGPAAERFRVPPRPRGAPRGMRPHTLPRDVATASVTVVGSPPSSTSRPTTVIVAFLTLTVTFLTPKR
jgi:hypothetical protein